MDSIQSSISMMALGKSTHSSNDPTAARSTRSVIPADHDAPPCKRFKVDNACTDLSFPLLSTRDIKQPMNETASHHLQPSILPPSTGIQTRADIGSKGLFLHRMQLAKIPVPPFTVLDMPLIAILEQHPFPSRCLQPFLPDIPWETCSLEQLRTIVNVLPHQQQSQWLKGLSGFIASEDCYQQITNISAAQEIRQRYLKLRQQFDGACIVRSSCIDTDLFGDARAGRFDSRVHGGGDILKTCLQVLSSAYRPEACPNGQVKAMALILQQYIHCRLGGVVFSHSTLDYDTMQVDYALGQPRAGQSGTQPHRYTIRRWGGEDSELDYQFTPGDIATQFALVKATHEEGYPEQATAATTDAKEHLLADATLKKLLQYAQNLEDIVCCPVYFTFGVGDGPEPYLFQFRPVTRLQGSTHSLAESTALPLAEGIMVSEGCPSSVTRVAGSFAERPGAWLLTENHSNSTTAGLDNISFPTSGPAESPDFTRVDEGFGWINRQTARLLDYFHADGLISRCLGPGQSKAVSMSPNRSMLLLQLALEILSLKGSLHQFVSGYRRFLDLGTGYKAGARPSEVQPFIDELPFLKEQWRCLEDAIDNLYPKVVTPLITDQELPEQPPKFSHWLRDCQALGDALQKLNQPGKVCDIHSARDLIYWLHQRFISALAPVAEASGQGEINRIAKKVRDRTQIDLLPQGVSGLLNDNYKSVLAKVNAQRLCMLNMVTAAHIKVALRSLVYTITMTEQAEGVKDRTLTLHIADDFSRDNIDLQGRLKRFWFLVQTLRCASIEIDLQPMAISFNQSEGTMTIEYTRVNSTLALKTGFVTLMYILSGMECMDVSINKFNRGNNTDRWCFETLVEKCKTGLDDPLNNWTFKHCLVVDAVNIRRMPIGAFYDYTFLKYLDSQYRLLFDMADNAHCRLRHTDPNINAELRQNLTTVTKHLGPDDAAIITNELLAHMAIESRFSKIFIQLLREDFGLDNDRDRVLFLVQQNPLIFSHISDKFKDDIEIAESATGQQASLLLHASNRLKNYKSLVMLAVKNDGKLLNEVSTDLRNDPQVAMAAARQYPFAFCHAGSMLKSNEQLLRIIIKESPLAMIFATDSLKNDKDFVMPLLSRDASIYRYLSDRLKSDPDIQAAAGH